MEEADQAKRDRERHRVDKHLGKADELEPPFERVRDRRLAQVAEAERADSDAELRAGHHQRDVLHRA